MSEVEKPKPNDRLRNARLEKRWSREEVAQRVGANQSSIVRWEAGDYPSRFYREKLCNLFGMSEEELGLVKEASTPPSSQEEQLYQSPDEVLSQTSEDTVETSQSIPHPSAPPQHKKSPHMLIYTISIAVLVLVLIGVIHVAFPRHIEPGGGWISPVGQTVGDVIHFAAYAYPTNKGDPEIDHVNFTAYWQGIEPRTWKIVCTAHTPSSTDVFSCEANIRQMGAPAGHISISFDVYDTRGNVNLAPNGVHTFTYLPS